MNDPQYISRAEAAIRCGKSKDTIRKYQRDGKLPNSKLLDGVTMIAVSDLVAANLLDPLADTTDVFAKFANQSKTDRELTDLAAALAVLQAQYDAACHENTFLRELLMNRPAA